MRHLCRRERMDQIVMFQPDIEREKNYAGFATNPRTAT